MENFWQACSSQLEQELTPQQFSAWIKPLTMVDFEEGHLRIGAPNRFKLDWVKAQFASRIAEFAAQFWDDTVDVEFIIDPRAGKKPISTTTAPSNAGQGNGADHGQRTSQIGQADGIPNEPPPETAPRRDNARINFDLTFDSFVTGKANQLARAAAIQAVSYTHLTLPTKRIV